MKLENVLEANLPRKNKWPIADMHAPVVGRDGKKIFAVMTVNLAQVHAASQAFHRYKQAHPDFDYCSRRDGETQRFWRTK
jgi:hypothetical protein